MYLIIDIFPPDGRFQMLIRARTVHILIYTIFLVMHLTMQQQLGLLHVSKWLNRDKGAFYEDRENQECC